MKHAKLPTLIRALAFASLLIIGGCVADVQEAQRVDELEICGGEVNLIEVVRTLSAKHGLGFSYGTHDADFGKAVTFRLVGSGFEIDLLNAFSDTSYSMRLQLDGGDAGVEGLGTYESLLSEIKSDPSVHCP